MTVSFIGGGNWRKPPTCYKSVNNLRVKIRVMVFKAIFNNILVISGRSVLLVEVTGENLSHNVVSSTPTCIYKTTYDGRTID